MGSRKTATVRTVSKRKTAKWTSTSGDWSPSYSSLQWVPRRSKLRSQRLGSVRQAFTRRLAAPPRGPRVLLSRSAPLLRPVRPPLGRIRLALSQLACTHAHETLLWASKGRGARHTFNYDLINSPNPRSQVSSIWRIPTVPTSEKLHGYHPTQKPLRLVRRALLASTQEGDLVFDPFCGSGTTAVAAKELGRFFVGAELEGEFCELTGRRIRAAVRGRVLRAISEQRWNTTPAG
jgi:DNA methylase